MTNDESAIREVVNRWIKASKAGDVATVLNLMTDDVVFMVPGKEPFGKDVYATLSKPSHSNLDIEGTSDIKEIQVVGDWAYIRNYLEMTITPPNSFTCKESGLYAFLFLEKKQMGNGDWRVMPILLS